MAALLRRLPEPETFEERKTQREIRELLGRVAEQQVENLLSQWRGPDTNQHAFDGRDA
jgi:uncharacterized Zn finger protein